MERPLKTETATPRHPGAPATARTLVELLRRRAAGGGEAPAYTFLEDGEREGARWTWGELDRRARAVAAAIQERAEPGDRALLLYPPGLDFVAAFFGCLYAGVVAVPAYPPHGRRPLARLGTIVGSAEPRLALTVADQEGKVERAIGRAPVAEGIGVVATDRGLAGAEDRWHDPGVDAGDLAFLQYTSGSTADPRGVRVSHRNLLHNQELIGRAFGHLTEAGEPRPGVRVVGWLPLYHDMGLIGNVLHPLFLGCDCVLMAPVAFLQRPLRWLRAIERYRGTVSGGPNFAYEQCLHKIGEEERRRLDLSSWRVAFNGAEPVRATTLERFADAFAPSGFDRRAFFPCYGLAEATLFVSGGPPEAPPVLLPVEASALEENRVVEDASTGVRRVVGCGEVSSGHEVAIVDPESLARLPEGRVGEVWIAGPSVAGGYWRLPEESAHSFAAHLPGEEGSGPFLRTGDLGFLRGGELFVTGRLKELIILRGRNHYPHDLELTAEAAHPALRPGAGAAFAVDADGEERLVIAFELERRRHDEAEAAADAVRRAVAEEHEVQVHEVVLLRFGGVPTTSSGKIQRRACRAAHLAGELPVVFRSRLGGDGDDAEDEDGSAAPAAVDRAALLGLPAAERAATVGGYLRRRAARATRIPAAEIDPAEPLGNAGLDSLGAIELQHAVESELGVTLPIAEILGGASVDRLAAEVTRRLDGAEPAPASTAADDALPADDAPGDHPPSRGQRALWFLERLAVGSAAYHVAAAFRALGGLDETAFERALAALVARHPTLRTTFPADGGEPVRRVAARGAVDFAAVDAAEWSAAELQERLREAARAPFDLDAGPLLRVRVHRGGAAGGEPVVLVAVHHLVADFWSLAVLARELGAFYRQETGGEPASLPPPGAPYGEHVRRQEALLAGTEGERLFDGWRRRLAGELPELDLPADRPRPAVQSFRGALAPGRIDRRVWSRLETLARRSGATPFAALLAAYGLLLGRLAGQREVVVGAPTVGRGGREFDGTAGYFVNPVALRLELGGDATFADGLERARRTALDAFELRDLPFPLLVERLLPSRDPSRSPIFQAMLVYQSAPPGGEGLAPFSLGEAGPPVELGGLTIAPHPLDRGAAIFDLTLFAAPGPDPEAGVGLAFEYNADLFDHATVRRWARHLERLVAAAVADPDLPGSALPLLAPAERHQLVSEWAVAPAPRRLPAPTLHGLFFHRAAEHPDATALVAGERRLGYRRLASASAALARRLRALGVGPEVPVAVCAERDAELVVALLGVLAAGGAYVPLDPSYPRERLAFLLEDAQRGVEAPVLLTQRHLAGRLPEPLPAADARIFHLEEVVDLDAPSGDDLEEVARLAGEEEDAGRHLAYLIYTSGSTGRPKGVAIEHRSAVARVAWAAVEFGAGELAGVLAATSVCFDLSIFELFAPLALGGTVVLADDALALPSLPAAEEVTLVNTVPSAIAELVRLGALPPSVRTVNLAGEPLKGELVRRVYGAGNVERVLNLYGPSEDTTYSTGATIPRHLPGEPTIGRALPGGAAHVVDRRLEPVPAGVVGELLVGGVGVARGYLGRPGLTAGRFVPDPFGHRPGDRLYRTGDLVRRRPDGVLEFLGRADHQVKIRGFRIELGEIEAALARHPAVAEAVVVARAVGGGDDGSDGADRRLVAYVEPRPEAGDGAGGDDGGRVTAAELRDHLAGRLPGYLVPAVWELLDQLPRTPNGKVDRKRLPAPTHLPAEGAAERASDPVVELLAGLWGELLGRGPVGPDDNFFALGGHSLLAARLTARVRSALGVELPLSAVFEAPTVASLARRVRAARGGSTLPPIASTEEPSPGAEIPLSFAQERFWVLEQLEPGTPLYNLPAAVRLRGELDAAALAAALTAVVARHDALRTAFDDADGDADGAPVGRLAAPATVPMPTVDLRRLAGPERAAEARRLAAAEARRPFDLRRAPLLRAALLAVGDRDHLLVLNLHHAAADGWSLGLFQRHLAAAYADLAHRRSPRLPEPPVRYADFAVWQRRLLAGGALESQLERWRRRLGGELPVVALPSDRPHPARPSPRGGTVARRFDPAPVVRFEALCRRRDATLFLGLLTVAATLLRRFGGGTDLPIGTPVANRRRQELEEVVGCFVNTLVLRLDLAGEPTFAEALARSRAEALGAFLHQDLPFERLVEELRPERQLGRNPLFDVMFTLQEAPPWSEVAGVRLEPAELDFGIAKLDLTLVAERRGDELTVAAEYRRDLFDDTTATRLLGAFERLLEGAAEEPETPITRLPLLAPAESHQLLREWNDTAVVGDAEPIHRAVARVAARSPDAPALVTVEGEVSYRELMGRAVALAGALRRAGVGEGDVVALHLDREDAATALLGVLEAGAAYLPLARGTPKERLAELLRDARPAAVVVDGEGRGVVAAVIEEVLEGGCPVLDPLPPGPPLPAHPPHPPRERGEKGREKRVLGREGAPLSLGGRGGWAGRGVGGEGFPGAETPAYLLYTSGSTGRPKGVVVPHRALSHLARTAAEAYRLTAADRVLHFASPAFDVTVEELFPTWLAGGTAVLWDDRASLDPRDFLTWTAARGVTVMNLPGSYWHEVAAAVAAGEAAVPASLRLMVTGSEAIATRQLARWRRAVGEGVELRNAYGVTEATVTSAVGGPVDPAPGLATVPIGRPLEGVRLHLLERGEAVPIGVRGELHVGGDGVATGYLRRPARTAGAFVPDPFGPPGARLYRTGDLARHRADGTVQFLGRADHQVKIRGFRVELGEVEAALGRHPAVAEAAAVVVGGSGSSGTARLVACFVPEGGEPGADPEELRAFLRRRLPPYEVPAAVLAVDRFPRTATGKTDRRALARTAAERAAVERTSAAEPGAAAPRTPAEEVVAGIFRRVLEVEAVAPDDDFFALGGHSLAAIRALSRLRRELGVELPLARFFEAPTVAGVAAAVTGSLRRSAGDGGTAPIPRRPVRGRHPAAFSQERLWFLDHLLADSGFYNLAGAFRLRGPLEVAALRASVAEIVRRHGALRTVLASEGGEIVQVVGEPAPSPVPVVDLSALPPERRREEADAVARRAARRPFDLRRGPLLRLLLPRLDDRDHLLVVAMHHVISDAWSLDVFARELAALYGAFAAGERPRLAAPARQYADYAAWQRQHLAGEVLDVQVEYWRRRLAGAPTVLDLPADRPRPEEPTFRGANLPFALDPELSAALAELSRERGATLFMTLLAAFEVLIFHTTGRRDFLLGTDVANRHRVETEGTLGFFVNSLALRSDIDPELPWSELLARVRRSSLEAFAHQDLPFHKLVEILRPDRSASRNPLFQVMFIVQAAPAPAPELAALTLDPHDLGEAHSVFDLTVSLELDRAGTIRGHFRYSTDLFEPDTIAQLGRAYERLLRRIVGEPESRVADLRPHDEEERRRRREERRSRRRRRLDRLTRVRPKALDPGAAVEVESSDGGEEGNGDG